MTIKEITDVLESWAPKHVAEEYDNVGLLTGQSDQEITNVLISLDCIESTVQEAKEKNCNLIIAHHPIIFKGLKKINGYTYVERTIIAAIKYDIAIYAIHTNLDNVLTGVNKKIADLMGLENQTILTPKPGGEQIGSGIIGTLPTKIATHLFLAQVKASMNLPLIRHTAICRDEILKVAICGGSGSFLLPQVIASAADAFITADIKYHEFFDADSRLILMDIGHFESEQYTSGLIQDYLKKQLPALSTCLIGHSTNPVHYFL